MASGNAMRITRAGIIFIIVVILLGLAIFAGVWFVKERGEQARREEASEIARENLEGESNGPSVIAEDEETNGSGASSDEDTEGGAGAVNDGDVTETPVTGTAQLPQTGGELTQLLAVVSLTLATAFFVTSQRAARQL